MNGSGKGGSRRTSTQPTDYTGAHVEELANTLYILCADGYSALRCGPVVAEGAASGPAPEMISVSRQLIDAALEEMSVEHKAKISFHAASNKGTKGMVH